MCPFYLYNKTGTDKIFYKLERNRGQDIEMMIKWH